MLKQVKIASKRKTAVFKRFKHKFNTTFFSRTWVFGLKILIPLISWLYDQRTWSNMSKKSSEYARICQMDLKLQFSRDLSTNSIQLFLTDHESEVSNHLSH